VPPKTLHDVGEVGLLTRLNKRLEAYPAPAKSNRWQVGMGDDAAVLKASGPVVVTTDMMVENVDFRRSWASFADVGAKAAAINLSDLAAMGAEPVGLNVALAAAPSETVADMLRLLVACHRAGLQHNAPVTGGDLSQTEGPLMVSVTALGVARHGPVLRHRAQVGDTIAVTGSVGSAAAGLLLLENPALVAGVSRRAQRSVVSRQKRPCAQVAVAQALAQHKLVRSMADVSDGLYKDVRHLLPQHLGARVDTDALPLGLGVVEVARVANVDALNLALCGGEDFELVMAVAPAHLGRARRVCAQLGVALTAIGTVTAGRGVRYVGHAAQSLRHGHVFNHFC